METANGLHDRDIRATFIDFTGDVVNVTFVNGITNAYPIVTYRDHVKNGLIIPDDAEIAVDGVIQHESLDSDVSDDNSAQTGHTRRDLLSSLYRLFAQVRAHIASDLENFLKDLGLGS